MFDWSFIGHGILLVREMRKNPYKPAPEPFQVIYKKLALPLTKFIVKRVGGDQDAVEEVFSRTLEAAWKGWNSFEHKSTYFTWLCRIALNKAADYYRDQVNERSRIITPTFKRLAEYKSSELSPEEYLVLEELKVGVNDCLNLLPYKTRRLLWLRYWKELTLFEIAKMMGISERAVEGRLYRARATMEEIITLSGKVTVAANTRGARQG